MQQLDLTLKIKEHSKMQQLDLTLKIICRRY